MTKSFWEKAQDRALQTKIRQTHRAIIVGQEATNDEKLYHPNEIREYATNKRFTEADKRITDEHNKAIAKAMERHNSIGAGKR